MKRCKDCGTLLPGAPHAEGAVCRECAKEVKVEFHKRGASFRVREKLQIRKSDKAKVREGNDA